MSARRDLVIFGAGDFAERARFYFDTYTAHRVVGFCVDSHYRTEETFAGLPLVAFEEIVEVYPPGEHDIFAAVGYADLNATRRRVHTRAVTNGYGLASCVAPSAVINASNVGPGSIIFDNATIGPFATLGPGLVVAPNAVIGHHSVIGGYSYISAGAVISGRCRVGEGVFLGARCVLRDAIEVTGNTFVAMGSVVTRSIVREGTYAGHPARMLKAGP